MKPNLFLITFMLSVSIVAYADDASFDGSLPRQTNIMPPTPDVGALMKALDVQTDYFHGRPQISVPIFTISCGELSLPIGLSYTSQGQRYGETPGPVGYGWTLTVAGVISRTVYGMPDETNKNGLITGLLNLTNSDKVLRNFLKDERNYNNVYFPGDYQTYFSDRSICNINGLRYHEGKCDMANDIFNLSGIGFSGVFAYNDSKRMTLSTPDAIIVEPSTVSSHYPSEFSVTDLHGVTYTFDQEEKSEYLLYYGNPDIDQSSSETKVRYTSAWHMSKMRNLNGDSIICRYIEGDSIVLGSSASRCYRVPDTEMALRFRDTQSSSTRGYKPMLVSSVEGKGMRADFHYHRNSSRYTLDSITVHYADNPESVKCFSFQYSTTKLIGIKENGKTQYRFDYIVNINHNAEHDSYDFGNYYNGATNHLRIPDASEYITGQHADRAVNPNYCDNGFLKSITYPTGGTVNFEWEANRVSNLNNLLYGVGSEPEITSVVCDTLRYCSDNPSVSKLKLTNFRISNGTKTVIDCSRYFNFDKSVFHNTEYENMHSENGYLNYPRIEISDTTGIRPNLVKIIFLDKETIENNPSDSIKLHLPDGIYNIELKDPINITNNGVNSQLANHFREYSAEQSGLIRVLTTSYNTLEESGASTYWPGVRIKTITSDPGNEGVPMHKNFFYGDLDPSQCHGYAQHKPHFYHKFVYLAHRALTNLYVGTEVYVVGDDGLPSSPIDGNDIQYSRVAVSYTQNRDYTQPQPINGYYEQYDYTSIADGPQYCDVNENPYYFIYQPPSSRMWTSKAHLRGNLRQVKLGLGNKITTKNIEYHIPEYADSSYFTTDLFTIFDLSTAEQVGTASGRDYHLGRYQIIPYNKRVTREISTESTNGLSLNMRDTVEYEYFYPAYEYSHQLNKNLIKYKTYRDSQGNKLRTYYTYADRNNRFSDIIESETIVLNPDTENRILKATKNIYADGTSRLIAQKTLPGNNSIFNPSIYSNNTLKAQYLGSINKDQSEFTYDENGNIVQIAYRGRVVASYLWGYQGLYPVAEIKDIAYSDVISSLGSSTVVNLYSGNCDYNSVFISLRQSFPNADINTLTYHPLIGIMTATDSSGRSTTFNYDNQGRLADIRDFNGFILKKYEYFTSMQQ